ncbi:Protein of unknown function [Cotesia congregata]|uniref:Uncharacterized protein n=1 Tax=Cotesia congregata TaxID=51543 RepID=A0A8J2MNG8_COTCN|nr:Protein of unknown function [Cotesia congregata]
MWNAFYATIYKSRIVIPPLAPKIANNIIDAEISLSELDSTLISLKSGEAPGPDLVTNEFLKSLTGNTTKSLEAYSTRHSKKRVSLEPGQPHL